MKAIARLVVAGAMFASVAAGIASAQNAELDPSYGSTSLITGFRPVPFTVEVRAGGFVDAQTINPGCKGFIASAPDVRINYTAGNPGLIISVVSESDTTLVVHGPDGGWYCDDNSGANGRDPSLHFRRPESGQYDIWIGAPESHVLQAAELQVSEVANP